MDLKFDANGLIPAIVQDHYTKEVLTLAYMNAESLAITIDEGRTCFSARSRQELWRKGRPPATSSMWCPSPRTVTGRPGGGGGEGRPRLPHRRGELLLPAGLPLRGAEGFQL